jgi:transglutaminase superfamily protein/thrombospondin type 3 repeat protein
MKLNRFLLTIIFVLSLFLNANCQYNYKYFKNKFDSILVEYPIPLIDTDGDGLDDLFEKKHGTNLEKTDTDNDGLEDYLEIFKYKTNPLKLDSDQDGIIDSVWSERYEYSYVVRIIVQVGKPFHNQTMNTLNFDTKILKQDNNYSTIEYIIYPFVEPYLVPLIKVENKEFPIEYLNVDTLSKLSNNQLNEIKSIIVDAKSEMEKTVLLIKYIRENYELKDELFTQTEPLMEIRVADDSIVHVHKEWSPDELHKKYSFQTILKLNCLADEMVKNKSRGACGSTATLIAGIFKSAGIPTRIKQNFPFVTNKDTSQITLIKNIENNECILEKYRNGAPGDNHFFNEIFINGHWIDLDNYRLGNKWQNTPYLSSIQFNNWSDVDFANGWEPWIKYDKRSIESLRIRYKAYKTLSIEEIYPKN